MNRIIQQITRQYTGRLPEERPFYRPDELSNYDFPAFLIRRISIELQRNLAESMKAPQTDWANTDSNTVQQAWQQFVQAIRAETRLPASYCRAVIETAVADVLDMIVQPRKNIPEVIFGADEELTLSKIEKRVEAVVVYQHLGKLLPRYMQKKQLATLTKERCRTIITSADQRLTARYTPLNWTQMLDPLFVMVDGQVDPSLLRLFFEERNHSDAARRFEQAPEPLNRAQVIELLSAPNIDEPQPVNGHTLPDAEAATVSEQPDSQPVQVEDEPLIAKEEGEEPEEEDHSLNAMFLQHDQPEGLEVEAEDEDDSGYSWEAPPADPDNLVAPEYPEEEENQPQALFEEEPEEDMPMWKRFFSDEASAESNPADPPAIQEDESLKPTATQNGGPRRPAPTNPFDPDGQKPENRASGEHKNKKDKARFLNTPIFGRKKSTEPEGREVKLLKKQLSDKRKQFIKDIFQGSKQAYEQAVTKIATYGSWRDASRFIQKEIFKRNFVNIYSETAVDFTDRLQNYFTNKQNRN